MAKLVLSYVLGCTVAAILFISIAVFHGYAEYLATQSIWEAYKTTVLWFGGLSAAFSLVAAAVVVAVLRLGVFLRKREEEKEAEAYRQAEDLYLVWAGGHDGMYYNALTTWLARLMDHDQVPADHADRAALDILIKDGVINLQILLKYYDSKKVHDFCNNGWKVVDSDGFYEATHS